MPTPTNAARTFTFTALLLLAGCGASPSASAPTSPADVAPDLSGHWKSACTKTSDTQAIALDFTLSRTDWRLDYVTYGDATCATPFATVHIEGPYALAGRSASIAGAWNARFAFTKKAVIADADAASAFLANACGGGAFPVGQATDISSTGCAGLGQRPIGACGADYDVVSLDGKALRFGDRPKDNDMCTEPKRPTALSALAVTRVE